MLTALEAANFCGESLLIFTINLYKQAEFQFLHVFIIRRKMQVVFSDASVWQ